MKTELPTQVRLAEYAPFAFELSHTKLHFELFEDATIVHSELSLCRKAGMDGPLVLDGEELELLKIKIDGLALEPSHYQVKDQQLIIEQLPDTCVLAITTRFSPAKNHALSGLYMSGGRFCTQCEAQGFRRITYYPDRPDVMSRFTVRVEADKAFPTLLSNGNLLEKGQMEGGRHFALWQDPFKKPAYLFALVAGAFDMIEDQFTTMSGKIVPLHIYVDPGDAHLASYAMDALKRSMRWDEQVFGREYDLDLFMIVAVRSFNFGAMENKGLNIFNSSVLLADAATATDANFERIESVVAHEYFHNWTGNRITCRDWFQLCLKEGLTVFRDQEFSADQRGRVVSRIKDVKALRARQFPEDAGPLAHPVRPSSYLAIDNFYTATVYEKGAELIRALKTILGDKMFAKGMAHYFATLDGTAATMEQFIACFATVSGTDLDPFLTWYGQAGTPNVTLEQSWDAANARLTINLQQQTNPTPGQTDKQPVPIPVRIGLLGQNGVLSFHINGQTKGSVDETVLILNKKTQTWVLEGVNERPVVSAFRRFSAPVTIQMQRSKAEQALVIATDPDLFNRWEEAQRFGRTQLSQMTEQVLSGQTPKADPAYLSAISTVIDDPKLELGFTALVLQPPAEDEIFQLMAAAVPEAIHSARNALIAQIARTNQDRLLQLHQSIRPQGQFRPDAKSAGQRALANQALVSLAALDTDDMQSRIWAAWQTATNMTDTVAALQALDRAGSQRFTEAIDEFYQQWQHNPLVIDKWFMMQATSVQATISSVRALLQHPDFNVKNPNRARAVYGAFAAANLPLFHSRNGQGYQLLVDGILQIDALNPALAARLTGAFESWRQVEPERQKLAKTAIKTILGSPKLSKNTYEIASRQLA
ncbi:Membrane alanine aminopeptidase N [hydrothermal vent metagenome]|uniref:Membrane alanine aminopeptidase N n=1 Tax=hydrothermal vent metagenome TaxID=652676 RepID=A0A3B0RZC1_9ZZZZ